MTVSRPKKTDVPFRTDDEIRDLVSQFEACRWPYERWTHRAHLAVAVAYLTHYSYPEALVRIRNNIKAYNHSRGGPSRYHETITVFFLRLASAHLLASGGRCSMAESVDQLFQLYDMNVLGEYFSPDRLWSAEAKQNWIEPDLQSLPG